MSFFATREYLEKNLPEMARQVTAEVSELSADALISVRAEQVGAYEVGVRVAVLHGPVQSSHQWSYETAQEWLSGSN